MSFSLSPVSTKLKKDDIELQFVRLSVSLAARGCLHGVQRSLFGYCWGANQLMGCKIDLRGATREFTCILIFYEFVMYVISYHLDGAQCDVFLASLSFFCATCSLLINF